MAPVAEADDAPEIGLGLADAEASSSDHGTLDSGSHSSSGSNSSSGCSSSSGSGSHAPGGSTPKADPSPERDGGVPPLPPLPPPAVDPGPPPHVEFYDDLAKGFRRNAFASTPFGLCRLTPTKTGWQMTCTRPDHCVDRLCTKTRSNALGGEELNIRMLKLWAILGRDAACVTKASHADTFKEVVIMHDRGQLPSTADLDRAAPLAW
jgi:hypothetical protein